MAEEADLAFRLPVSQGSFVYDMDKQADVCYNPAALEQNTATACEPLFRGRGFKSNRLYPCEHISHKKQVPSPLKCSE